MTYGPFLREREETVLQAGWGWSTIFQPNWVRTVGGRWETEHTVTRGGVCSLPWIPIVVGAERQERNHAAEQLYLWGDERGRSHQGLRQSQIHMVTQIYPLSTPGCTHTVLLAHVHTEESSQKIAIQAINRVEGKGGLLKSLNESINACVRKAVISTFPPLSILNKHSTMCELSSTRTKKNFHIEWFFDFFLYIFGGQTAFHIHLMV